ncbi:hypothetical protein FHR55_001136 [Xanthomonas arboricola]
MIAACECSRKRFFIPNETAHVRCTGSLDAVQVAQLGLPRAEVSGEIGNVLVA